MLSGASRLRGGLVAGPGEGSAVRRGKLGVHAVLMSSWGRCYKVQGWVGCCFMQASAC